MTYLRREKAQGIYRDYTRVDLLMYVAMAMMFIGYFVYEIIVS